MTNHSRKAFDLEIETGKGLVLRQ